MLTEDDLRHSILVLHQGVEDGIVCAFLLAAMRKRKVREKANQSPSWSHDALKCTEKHHVYVVVHPIHAKTELGSGLHDTCSELLLFIGKTECARLEYKDKGQVDVVNAIGALVVGEQGVEDHDSSTMHDEADLALEGGVQPLGQTGECLHERNAVQAIQSWNNGRRQDVVVW